MVEKLLNVGAIKQVRVLLVVEVDVLTHPVDVGSFGVAAIVLAPYIVSHLLQELWFFFAGPYIAPSIFSCVG